MTYGLNDRSTHCDTFNFIEYEKMSIQINKNYKSLTKSKTIPFGNNGAPVNDLYCKIKEALKFIIKRIISAFL